MGTHIDFVTLKKRLLKEINYLEKDIDDLENDCLFEQQSSLLGIGHIKNQILLRMPAAYINSAFFTCRDQILPLITTTFEPTMIKRIFNKMEFYQTMVWEQFMVLCCFDYKQTPQGVILTLGDPYRKKQTFPIKDLPYSSSELDQRLLRVKAQFLFGEDTDQINCQILELLPLRLHKFYNDDIYYGTTGWTDFKETEYSNYLAALKTGTGFQYNTDEVVRFVNAKKATGSFGHAEKKAIIESGYTLVQDKKNKYILIPRENGTDVIVFKDTQLTKSHIWAYESFWLQDDLNNKIDPDTERLIRSY